MERSKKARAVPISGSLARSLTGWSMVATALAMTLSPGVARGQVESWHLRGEIGTDFPVSAGGRVSVESPSRLRLSTSFGYLPGPYVDVINAWMVNAGAYTQDTASLARQAVQNSMVWRTHLGFRPFRSLGLYADAGYTLIALGGGASTEQVIAALTGATLPRGGPMDPSTETFDLASTVHMVDVEIGWQFLIAQHWYLRAALGGAFAFAESSSLTPEFQPVSPEALAAFTRYAESSLDETIAKFKAPVATVSVGYEWQIASGSEAH
jgi:hypothetical protein